MGVYRAQAVRQEGDYGQVCRLVVEEQPRQGAGHDRQRSRRVWWDRSASERRHCRGRCRNQGDGRGVACEDSLEQRCESGFNVALQQRKAHVECRV